MLLVFQRLILIVLAGSSAFAIAVHPVHAEEPGSTAPSPTASTPLATPASPSPTGPLPSSAASASPSLQPIAQPSLAQPTPSVSSSPELGAAPSPSSSLAVTATPSSTPTASQPARLTGLTDLPAREFVTSSGLRIVLPQNAGGRIQLRSVDLLDVELRLPLGLTADTTVEGALGARDGIVRYSNSAGSKGQAEVTPDGALRLTLMLSATERPSRIEMGIWDGAMQAPAPASDGSVHIVRRLRFDATADKSLKGVDFWETGYTISVVEPPQGSGMSAGAKLGLDGELLLISPTYEMSLPGATPAPITLEIRQDALSLEAHLAADSQLKAHIATSRLADESFARFADGQLAAESVRAAAESAAEVERMRQRIQEAAAKAKATLDEALRRRLLERESALKELRMAQAELAVTPKRLSIKYLKAASRVSQAQTGLATSNRHVMSAEAAAAAALDRLQGADRDLQAALEALRGIGIKVIGIEDLAAKAETQAQEDLAKLSRSVQTMRDAFVVRTSRSFLGQKPGPEALQGIQVGVFDPFAAGYSSDALACAPDIIVGARGSGESGSLEHVGRGFGTRINQAVLTAHLTSILASAETVKEGDSVIQDGPLASGVEAIAVAYDAPDVPVKSLAEFLANPLKVLEFPKYAMASREGAIRARQLIGRIQDKCPKSRISLIGYSSGSWVIGGAYADLSSKERGWVRTVTLVSYPAATKSDGVVRFDPHRELTTNSEVASDQGSTVGVAGSLRDGFRWLVPRALADGGLNAAERKRVTELCIDDDAVCDPRMAVAAAGAKIHQSAEYTAFLRRTFANVFAQR